MLSVDVNQKVNKISLTDDGDVATEPGSISNSFNNFFVDVGPKLTSDIKHSGKDYFEYLSNPTQKTLLMKPIVADEVVKIVSKLNQNESLGHDGIGNLIVKKATSIISKPLADIFNLSFQLAVCQNSLNLLRLYPFIKKRILKYSQITVLYLYYLAFQKY